MQARMRIFITGGSGFVGRNTISELRRKGHRVRALARSDEAARSINAAGGEPVRGELSSVDALVSGISGCEGVIHAAAKVEQWGKYEDFYQVNVVGTENVLAAAAKAGAKRFVHVGTEAVLVGERLLINASEDFAPPARSVGLYPMTKRLAEERVLASCRRWWCARASSGAGATPRYCHSSWPRCKRASSCGFRAGATSRRPAM
jgi:nucleoside-diphosphate-sugar epimerase